MKRYRHIFFDLDHTLWDFESNSRATLMELFAEERLDDRGVSNAAEFIEVYEEINRDMWQRFESGQLDKQVMRVLRFRNSLLHFGVRDGRLAERLGRVYLERCPRKAALMPGALKLLEDLRDHYALHIITNGFDEVQQVKMECSGITGFFDVVLTSEKAGARKPDPRIFEHALRRAKAEAAHSLMVGDSREADMAGARGAGWDHAHFSPAANADPDATYRVAHMDELRSILL